MSAIPFRGVHPLLSGLRHAELRGVWLSHLIGFSYFFSLIFARILSFDLPYTKVTEIPIRLVAIWLLVDRIGRRGKVKVSTWDYIHLGFAACYAFAMVYADAFMVREIGIQGYVSWALGFLSPYFYFLIAREGTLRRGFKPHVVLNWILVSVLVACLFALAQGSNVLGLRDNIDMLVRQRQAEAKMEGPSMPWQARGLMTHANSMAIMIIQALSLLFGAINFRRAGPFEITCLGVFILTLFATFSRTGIASFVVLALAIVILLMVQRKIRSALTLFGAIVALGFVFVSIVYAFDIDRYKVFVRGAGPIKNEASRGLQGYYLRQATIERALRVVDDYPLTGIQPASSTLNLQRVYRKSAYSYEGLLLNAYVFAWVAYGLPGLIFLIGIFSMSIGQLRFARSNRAFAPAAFLVGVAIAITGMTENTPFEESHMIIANIIMAFAIQKLARENTEDSLDEENPFIPYWMKWLGLKSSLGSRWRPQ